MNKEIRYLLNKLKDGFLRLQEGIQEADSELARDGVIQRFEFTFELLWKSLKIFLEHQGIVVKTPRETFEEAFRVGLIQDEQSFIHMLEARNQMSHIYSREESQRVFERIRGQFAPAISGVLERLDQKAPQ